MSAFLRAWLTAGLLGLAACNPLVVPESGHDDGGDVSEVAPDPGSGSDSPQNDAPTPLDTGDGPPDESADVPAEVAPGDEPSIPETPSDAVADEGVEASVDLPVDHSQDEPDDGMVEDGASDAGPDSPPDTGVDAAPDAPGSDPGPDAVADSVADVAVDACVPACADKECGPDGCGGLCGECESDSICASGACLSKCWTGSCPSGFQTFDGCHCKVPPTFVVKCRDQTGVVECPSIGADSPFYGQDGHYPSGLLAFESLGDGTVRDKRTGLVWSATMYSNMKWQEGESFPAKEQCEKNKGGLPGSNWRLPTIWELLGLIVFSKTTCPVWDTPFGGSCPTETGLWSSTPTPSGVAYPMMTSFFEPVIYSCGDLGASAWVKCVQDGWGGDTPSRFVLQDPHVADRVTGLLWDRLPACVECDWSSALKLCAGRGDGWRLPNAKELMSLVDYAKGEYPYWSAVFDTSEAVPRWFWSSTPGFRSIESLAYMVDFGHGQLQGMDISSTGFGARCVRTGTQ